MVGAVYRVVVATYDAMLVTTAEKTQLTSSFGVNRLVILYLIHSLISHCLSLNSLTIPISLSSLYSYQ